MKTRIAVLLISVLFLSVDGANFISNALGDHMVLQRAPQSARIWGWTEAWSIVKANFDGQVLDAVADRTGFYKFDLPPTEASDKTYNITVLSSNGQSGSLNNVLFGDVYLCGGQSNMQFSVLAGFNATQQVALAANYPLIRVFTVGQKSKSYTPLEEFGTIEQNWTIASPQSIGGGQWTYFSAVCWFFGKDVFDKMQIPIGLLSDNWGGTLIQSWSSPDALAKCLPTPPRSSDIESANDPSVLWNAMISPVLNMRIRGALWYQGEQNWNQPGYYRCALPAMINDWRLKWRESSDEFAFLVAQLSAWYPAPDDWIPEIRLTQSNVSIALENVRFAMTSDLGDIKSPFGSVHPRNKETVGLRLSASALAMVYHRNVPYLGPTFQQWSIDRNSKKVIIAFERDSLGGGLEKRSFTCPSEIPSTACVGFELQFGLKMWNASEPIIVGDQIELPYQGDDVPLGVRYLWSAFPACTIYNRDGFPAPSFNTVAWTGPWG